jgi:hypothetical protein
VGGDNVCHPRGATVVGNVAGDPVAPGAIVVPSYANHPDAIWTPQSAIDDHFDGSTLNAKWTVVNTGMVTPVNEVGGSSVSIGGSSPTDNLTLYQNYIMGNLPNGNPFTLTIRVSAILLAYPNSTQTASYCYFWFRIENANSSGSQIAFTQRYDTTGTLSRFSLSDNYGVNLATAGNTYYISSVPNYIRFIYDSAKLTTISFSYNGVSWFSPIGRAGTLTGFSTAAPSLTRFGVAAIALSRGMCQVDWIRFTNP